MSKVESDITINVIKKENPEIIISRFRYIILAEIILGIHRIISESVVHDGTLMTNIKAGSLSALSGVFFMLVLMQILQEFKLKQMTGNITAASDSFF